MIDRRARVRIAVGTTIAMAAVAVPLSSAGGAHLTRPPTATITDTNGVTLGTVSFAIVDGKMQVSTNVKLPPQFAGFRGMHLHRVGVCDRNANDTGGVRSPFFSASAHIGSEDGHSHYNHDGDLPPLLVNRDGTVRMTVRTDRVSFQRIFDADGTAVIIHALPDNLAHIPARYSPPADATTLATGDAGARVACGVVRK